MTVGPYAAGEQAVGTETVYDALGRVAETRRWKNVEIPLTPFIVDPQTGDFLVPTSNQTPAGKRVGDGKVVKNAWDGVAPTPTDFAWLIDHDADSGTAGLVPNLTDTTNCLSRSHTDYDTAGRVYRSYAPTQNATGKGVCTQEIRYDAAGRQVEVISLPGSAQEAISTTEYQGTQQWKTIDARGNKTGSDPDDYTTTFEYDDLGRVVKTIHPATSYKVVAAGNTIGSASGPVYSHVGYDGFGRKAWETPGPASFESADDIPANQRKWYSYDAGGRLTKVVMPVIEAATGVCPVYRYFYDAYGNQIAIVDPLGRVTRFVYNELNLLTQRYQPFVPDPALSDDATTADVVALSLSGKPFEGKSYSTLGRILAEIDCEGHSTVYRYYKNEVGNVDHYMNDTTFLGIPGQLRIEESYEGSPVGTPASSIAYIYDTLGRKKTETVTPGTDVYKTWYDEEGRVEVLESPQGDLLYEYSPITGNKIATMSYPATMDINQIRADAAATPPYVASTTRTVYTYDDLGRLYTVQVVRRNGVAVNEDPTTYHYNKAGSQEKVIYPNVDSQNNHVGNEAVYEYDALNRLVRLTNYKDSGHVESQLLSRFEYSCYANGQRATAVETRMGYVWTGSTNVLGRPTREIAHQYDGLGRLTREQRNGNDPNEFAYDLVGNRVTQVIGNKVNVPGVDDNETTSYSYNERDQLYQEVLQGNGLNRTITYGYDANGSLESQTTFGSNGLTTETVVYEYNLQSRLKQVTATPYTNGVPGTAVITQYDYDPSGNRISKQVGTETPTVYLVDPLNPTGYSQVLQETTGSTVTTYTLGSDVIGQTTGSADPVYLLYDGHGSVRNHANASGDLIWFDIPGLYYDTNGDDPADQDYTLYTYDAWGQECRRPTGEGLYYSGEMYDQNLAMYNLRARYYNPANGRFNALDPYAGSSYDPQSLHKYLYCHGDPVNGIDPSGLLFSSLYHGKIVHDQIGADFMEHGINPIYDTSINSILELGRGTSIWGLCRPDLVEIMTGEVYEIKPIGSYIQGVAQLGWYLALLNVNDPLKRVWIPGSSYSPPSVVRIDNFSIALVSPPAMGVIQYQVIDPRPALKLATAYSIAWIYSEISARIQLKMLTPGLAMF